MVWILLLMLPWLAMAPAGRNGTVTGAGFRVGCGPAAPQARAAVLALERRWLAKESNPAVVGSILAADFVHVVDVGPITRAQHLGYLEAHPHAFAGPRRFERLQVRVYGSVAIVTGAVLTPATASQKASRFYFTDVFAYHDGRWQAVNAQETPAGS